MTRVAGALLLAAVLLPGTAAAQRSGSVLPGVRHFTDLRADLLEPRMGAGLVLTNILATNGGERPGFVLPDSGAAAREVQGAVALGATLPLLRLAEWPDGGIVLAGQAGISARFRIERPSRDDLGQDWFVAIPLEIGRGDWSYRLRLSHRSSHLGDEFMQETGAERLEFGGEAFDAHMAHSFGTARAYVGSSWIFRSYTTREPVMRALGRRDRFLFQAGADAEWRTRADARTSVVAGIDVQAAERTRWRRQVGVVGGVRWAGADHALQLRARVFDGPSFMGEFFLTSETFWSLEFVAEL